MYRNLVAGLLLAAVAAAYYMAADDLTISPLDVAAATTDQFPKRIAVAVIILSLILMAQALLARRQASAAAVAPESGRGDVPGQHRRAAVILAIGIAYVALLNIVGYVAVTVLLVAAGAWFLGRRGSLEIALVAAGTTLLSWLLFEVLLGIQMPAGQWMALLPGGRP